MLNYAKHVSTQQTPQTEPIPGAAQVENSAGGFTWALDDWGKLDRFLILGPEGGSYYASERALTRTNAATLERLLKLDGRRVVARTAEVSDAGRAPKNDPAIFVLALALKTGDAPTRAAARAAVSKVCRIGTHIFQLAEAVKQLGGWGRGTKSAFAGWYLSQAPEQLAMNLVKYQNRGGWSHRDLLRKAHVHPVTAEQNALFRWAAGKSPSAPLSGIVAAFEQAKIIGSLPPSAADTRRMVGLIVDTSLPRECVPTGYLNELEVWDALLRAGKHGMPMTAMIRNLGKMSAIGLTKPLSEATRFICEKLRNAEALKAARVHPLQLLLALCTYRQGHGDKGALTWTVAPEITDALDDAFYLAFANVEPTGKRMLLAIDVSGSMDGGRVAGTSMTPREASAALALVTARTESRYALAAFSHQLSGVRFTARTRLSDAVTELRNIPMGNTDCSLPMLHALEHKLETDVFVVYTDSETYAGRMHPSQALRSYRQATGIDAKLIVVGMTANDFTIADPNDRGMLDVVGFDSNVPVLISDFIK